MPPATLYVPPFDRGRSFDLYNSEVKQRAAAYDYAYRIYQGAHPKQLSIKEGEPDDNVTINLFKQVVDRTSAFLFPSLPKMEVTSDPADLTYLETWLSEVWKYNGGVSLLHEIAMAGALSGHVYVRILQANPSVNQFYPQLLVLNPGSVITYWREDNIKEVLWHEIRWSVGKTDYVLDVVNNPEYKRWDLYQYGREGGAWELVSTELWPSVYGPIVEWKHLPNVGSFYGQSEASNLSLNFKLNLVASEISRILRYYASPRTIATGVNAADIRQVGTDELWAVENSEARFQNLEMTSDLKAAREYLSFLYDNFLTEHGVVILKGEVADFQRVTNAGIRTVFMDMLSKNNLLRWTYGNGLAEISRRLLFLLTGNDSYIPTIVHTDPLPTDQAERIAVAAQERALGLVSRETLSHDRGYDWNVELEKMLAEEKLPIFNNDKNAIDK